MRKNYFFGILAMAALALTGCTKDQVLNEVPQAQAVEFGTYVGRDAQTKAGVTTNTELLNSTAGFGVFAYKGSSTTPDFMYNQQVTYASGAWGYSPVKYWPNSGTVNFYAYAPYNAAGITIPTNTTAGNPNISYVVDQVVTNQLDLLYASAPGKSKDASTVNFEFQHALSRVGFKVEALVDPTSTEKETNGTNDVNKGDNTLDANTTITVSEVKLIGNFYKKATLDLTNGNWAYTGRNTYNISEFSLGTTNFVSSYTITKEPDQLNDSDDYLMIFPQGFTGDDKLKISVTYEVTTTDNTHLANPITFTNTANSDLFNFTFEKGKAYNFVLYLGLNSVKFNAEVSAWDPADGTDVVVNVPLN